MRKGLNSAVTPKRLPVTDIVTLTESAYRSLTSGDDQELPAKVINIGNKHDKIKDQNMSDEEWRVI